MEDLAFDGVSPEAQVVLLAALDKFAELGYHGTTTRGIAQAAKKSPTAIYNHYPSKRELLFQVVLRGHQELLELIRRAREGNDSPTSELVCIATAHAKFHAERYSIARVSNYDLQSLAPEALEMVLSIRREIEQIVRNTIANGISRGEFDVRDGDLVATAILSMGIDVSRWYRPQGRLTVQEIGESYARFALQMVGRHSTSTAREADV